MSTKGKLKTLQKVSRYTSSGIRLVLISGTILLAVACGRGSSSRTTVIPPVTPNGMSSGSLRKDSTYRNTSRTTGYGNSYHQSGTGYRSGSGYSTTTQPKNTYSTQWDKSGKSTSTSGHSTADGGSHSGSASHSNVSTKNSSSTASGISRGGFGASAKSSSSGS